MNDDDLKTLWQQQPLREQALSTAQLTAAMQEQTSRLRHNLDARDVRELLACAFVVLVFGCFSVFLHADQPISRLGDWIVIGGVIFIAWKIIYTRRTTPPAPPSATIVESLRAELNAVRAQSRLLGSVLWWYLLPGFAGLVVMTWGSLPINDPGRLLVMIPINILMTLFFVAGDVFVYRLNQQARTRQLLPLEAQLESLLHSAETGEPLDETQMADLRPIALSMAAADLVKPIEFQVAFWQIALWGEIGFVGIWFFSMVAVTMGDTGWQTTQQGPESLAPSIRVEEADRYSRVTRKVVDLLNTGDYASIQKMFNADMSDALPPQKASELFTNLTARLGRIEKFDGPVGNGYRGWIAFRLHGQHAELTMSLVLDTNDNISGIYFQPAVGNSLNFNSFVSRLFSPRHLALIVPFSLAGLLYSWLLQKLTKRAVGISILGIHLHKGQDLMLWGEVKEIQPLKVLNIRSLWLIGESGEKTVMPWSSLERHSDLKAAVEGLAPADHPIRKYLPLLKRMKRISKAD